MAIEALEKARTLLLEGDILSAERIVTDALASDQNSSAALRLLGLIKLQKKEYFEAERALKQVSIRERDGVSVSELAKVYYFTGRYDEAIDSAKIALEIDGNNTQTLGVLAESYRALGDVQVAKNVYLRALAVNPAPEIFNGLAVLELEHRNYSAAISYIDSALASDPVMPEALVNKGLALIGLKQFTDAEQCFLEALKHRPGFVTALSNLAVLYEKQGEFDEALKVLGYEMSIKYQASSFHQLASLCFILQYKGLWRYIISLVELGIAELSSAGSSKMASKCLALGVVSSWVTSDFKALEQFLKLASDPAFSKADRVSNNFISYVARLRNHCFSNPSFYNNGLQPTKKILVIGDSHSLAPHGIYSKCNIKFTSRIVMGLKAYHLACRDSKYVNSFKIKASDIEDFSGLLVTAGEIDCRPDEGIWVAYKRGVGNLDHIIKETVDGYISFVKEFAGKLTIKIVIQGVPAPNYTLDDLLSELDQSEFLELIRRFNLYLQAVTKKAGWLFFDVFNLTLGERGASNKKWHLDGHHLRPDLYLDFDYFLSKSSQLAYKDSIELARHHAESARFQDFKFLCDEMLRDYSNDLPTRLDIGALLSGHGFLNDARACYEKAQTLVPTDLRAQVNLANLARDAGEHAEARRFYVELLRQLPDHPVIRRNALTSLEYAPEVPDAERLVQVQAWGAWAIARAGGVRPRPAMQPLIDRPLRIGYVSADLCQHTVGLFVKDVLKAHDPTRVQVFAYSAGQVKDWVTDEIRAACTLREVAALDDAALTAQIRADGIDVLVDLSGHTAGSRLTAFAHRPAPVMVSWLGYFATTGLPYMDAVLLDEWHAPPGTEAQFVEPILRLPCGRFCYQPVPWAPAEVSAPAFERNGFITLGCFNNTAKLNAGVFDAWAQVLHAVPDARLILKWRTFNDEAFRENITQAFVARDIAADRIELRGPSFHADLLKEYADIDIALDPFPFTGGLTSCEALWMGVPVVTWPQSRVVSRQTHAFLHQIGLPELSARDADDYVRIAAELANDQAWLAQLRATLRERMRASPLMDVVGFTCQLEDTLIDLYRRIEAEESTKAMNAKTILHVGPGHRNNGAKLPAAFQGSDWQEIRLDIDPANEPDIVGSMLDMAAVADVSVDAIYSAHNIEYVYAHEVPQVLKEFLRVLKPDGFLVVTCPDLQTVCQLVAEDKLGDAAYTSQAGPITPLDILYGHGAALAAGHHYMAHKTGFTLKTLTQALHTAGFATSAGRRRLRGLDLWVVASKGQMEEAALRELAGKVLPA